MIKLVKLIFLHRNAVQSQFFVNIKTTVAATRLGPLWWIIDPLLLMAIYTFVVKIVFNRGGPGYHIFALCGIVTWQCFSRSLTISSKSLRGNASLIRQTHIPLELYVLIAPIVQSFFYFIGLCIISVWNFDVVNFKILTVVLFIFPLIFLSFGLGLFLSVFDVYLPDTGKFLQYFLRIGFYMSPVLYSPERIYDSENISDILKFIYSLNPMVYLLSNVRNVLFLGQPIDLMRYLLTILSCLLFVQVGLLFFRQIAFKIPKNL